jgi:hypothetical protein
MIPGAEKSSTKAITRCCQGAESPAQQHLVRLRGVRLGRRERALLLAAPPSSSYHPPSTEGAYRIKEPTRSMQVATQRASKRLAELGLVHRLYPLAYKTLGVSIFRTEFGDEIVVSYRRQLEDGQRIRWGNA